MSEFKLFLLFIAAIQLFLVLVTLSTSANADEYRLIKKWGSFCELATGNGCIDPDGPGPLQKGDGQFNRPGDIALDPLSNVVYVVDNINHRIQKFDTNGKFITKWGSNGNGDGEFKTPGEISIDPSGRVVYVVDTVNDRVQKFDSNGKFITKWGSFCTLSTGDGCIDPDGPGPLQVGDGQFDHPGDIGLDSSSNVLYVTDSQNNRIQKFDSNGKFITKWGSLASEGQFSFPTGVAVDYLGRNIYVSDSKNDRIQKFDSNGKFITKWGSQCKLSTGSGCTDPDGPGPLQVGDGQFDHPGDIGLDSSSNVLYVTDSRNNRIQKFDSNGKFITKWGSNGTGDGQFKIPGEISIDSSNRVVYVVDTVNDRVQKFDTNGTYITKWGSFCTLSTGDGCIDPDGPGPLQVGDGQFDHPGDIGLDSSSNVLYVTDSQNNRIQKFDSNGKFITKWGSGSASEGQFSFPTGVAVDYLGRNIYVSDSKNDRIQKFDSNGKSITKWGSQCTLSTGSGCIDPDGPGPLQVGDGQFNTPRGIFVDSTGKLVYVVDISNDRIEKFDSNGIFITKWGSSGSNRGQFNTAGGISGIGLTSASSGGLFVDSSNPFVYVTDKENNNVQVFSRILATDRSQNEFGNILIIAIILLFGILIGFITMKSVRHKKTEMID